MISEFQAEFVKGKHCAETGLRGGCFNIFEDFYNNG